MITISGYQTIAQIYESANSVVYRGQRISDRQPVVLKVLKQDYPSPAELARYKQEYELVRSLTMPGVIQAYDLQKYQNTLVMVLEDFGGDSLRVLFADRPLALSEFLELGIKITDSLGEIHHANIIHKDINPANIVLNPAIGQIKIIDFGISTILSRENPTIKNPNILEGTLAYLSPEQTGRMNRALDYRTDFYSLGVTFYELLTRQRPFQGQDALEVVYGHIAKQPIAPHEVNPAIPEMVSAIVLKLMAKTAEERYQSAWGIKADLEICLNQLDSTGTIAPFPLGQHDISDKFQIPQKLYGREQEVALLLAAFDRVSGRAEAAMSPASAQPVRPLSPLHPETMPLQSETVPLQSETMPLQSETMPLQSETMPLQPETMPLRLETIALQSETMPLRPETIALQPKTPTAKRELVLVAGFSGIGKSALVQELYKPITQQRGYFIAGKFDQFQRNIPYSAIVKALQALTQQLLTESQAQLTAWKEKLLTALGANGQLIIDVIPEMELIVGAQPPVTELASAEAQNRFNLVFQKFIRVFCRPEHPLVMFLDDLQWADSATLRLLELMMLDEETQCLLLIGAYRDNEVNPTHPLMMTIDLLRKQSAAIQQITLANLQLAHITHLIADTLQSDPATVQSLADLVERKTSGNPFFVSQFLQTLYQENLLTFDPQQRRWQWDIAQIEAVGITDNVVELMIGKLKKLPETTQHALRLAACIGNSFNLATLSIIQEQTAIDLFGYLLPAVQERLILPTSALESADPTEIKTDLIILNYRFLHDRVQQAAYALIDPDQKQAVHLKIGQLLLANTPLADRADMIFELVDHLNLGRSLLTEVAAQIELATLNLEAGQKAKNSTAYVAAQQYLAVGLELLSTLTLNPSPKEGEGLPTPLLPVGEQGRGDEGGSEQIKSDPVDSWETHYDLTLALHRQQAELEFLNGNFEQSEALIQVSLHRAKSILEKAAIYRLLIVQSNLIGRYDEAVQAGRTALQMLGVPLPEGDLAAAVHQELAAVKTLLGDRNPLELMDLPEMVSLEKRWAVTLLQHVLITAYFKGDMELFSLASTKFINLCIASGHVPESVYGYLGYGLMLSYAGDYQSCYEFGLLALQLSEKFHNLADYCRTCVNFGYYILPWVKPMRLGHVIHQRGYQVALDCGEIQYAGFNLGNPLFLAFLQGANLEATLANLAQAVRFSEKTSNRLMLDNMATLQLSLWNLTGLTADKFNFDTTEISESQCIAQSYQNQTLMGVAYHHIFKAQVLYLYEEAVPALECIAVVKPLLATLLCNPVLVEYTFYNSLCLTALYPDAAPEQQSQYHSQLAANQQQLDTWAQSCPENFLHKALLVAAERARLAGQQSEAIDLYDQAIQSAKENEFTQCEALGNELAAKFWLARGKADFAKLYMTKAHYLYQLWGATRKVDDLTEKYSHLILKTIAASGSALDTGATILTTATATTTSGNRSSTLDLATVIKAAQAISGEIVIESLLSKLMNMVIENAGAQKGILILERDGQLCIEAAKTIDHAAAIVRQAVPIETSDQIPRSVVNYVARTQANVVLNNVTDESGFMADPYIQLHQPKSVLCMPIVNQGKGIGILYLENNLTVGAFTSDRLEVLSLLCSQSAISIDNALLYERLEDYSRTLELKVADRTQELKEKNYQLGSTLHELQAAQKQMIAQEKLASLGALTAGIAHEIRNPLNFVTNFAAVSVSLATELQTELATSLGGIDPETTTYIQSILSDLVDNSQEIKLQGSRAESIISNMLKHARKSEGHRQATDLNALLTESVRLAYYARRSKEQNFTMQINTEYSEDVGWVDMVPEEISRAFINLVDNACYATLMKQKAIGTEFKPTLDVQTRSVGDRVEIRLRDNGNGIPPDVQDKIFNPFFTTKPTGEGTGLGLSLTHEIITGQHRGQITVTSEPGVYTEFVITLPTVSRSQ